MLLDFITVTVSIVVLTVLTAERKNVIAFLKTNAVIAGTLISILQLLLFVGLLERSGTDSVEINSLAVMVLIRLRPLMTGVLYRILFTVAERVIEKQKKPEKSEKTVIASDAGKIDYSLLSRREIEVARLAAKGYTNAQIADTLFISGETVKRHMATVFEKLNISSRKELMLNEINADDL